MTLTLIEIADQMNALFREYGLTHDVVYVQGGITVDERESEPDPQRWRPRVSTSARIVLADADNDSAMSLLLETLKFVFQVYFEVQPDKSEIPGQLKLF